MALAYRPPGSLRPEAVGELPNYNSSTSPWGVESKEAIQCIYVQTIAHWRVATITSHQLYIIYIRQTSFLWNHLHKKKYILITAKVAKIHQLTSNYLFDKRIFNVNHNFLTKIGSISWYFARVFIYRKDECHWQKKITHWPWFCLNLGKNIWYWK